MTMNREMNVKCFRGGGAHLTSRRSCRSRVQRKSSSSSSSSSNFFLGVRWRGVSWPTTLMQLGVLLILVNSIVLCSCSSISINSQSSSISKNTVLGAEDGHHEAFGESAGAAAGAPPTTMSPTPTTSTTTTASGNGVMTTTTTPTTTIKSKGSTATDSSAEARRKEKKGSFSNDTSGKGAGVRINVSNNTTAPLVTVPSKPKSGGGAGKEYWNKQQKVASVLKGSKKGKYRFDAKLGRMWERELFLAGHLFGWNRFVDLLLLSGRRAFGWFIVPTAIPRDLLSAAWLYVW